MFSESIQDLPQTNFTDKLNTSTNLNNFTSLNTQISSNSGNQNLENLIKLDTHREFDDTRLTNRMDDETQNNSLRDSSVANQNNSNNNNNTNLNISNNETKATKKNSLATKSTFKSSLTV